MAARFVELVIASIIAFGRGDARAQCVVGATAIPSIQTIAVPNCAMAGFTQTLIIVVNDVLDYFGNVGARFSSERLFDALIRWTFPPEGSEEFAS